MLSKSGLTKHGDLRSHLMKETGLGHGHANAVVAIWLKQSADPPASARKVAAKKTPAKKK